MRTIAQNSTVYFIISGVVVAAISLGAAVFVFGAWFGHSGLIGVVSIAMVCVLLGVVSGRRRANVSNAEADNNESGKAAESVHAARVRAQAARQPVDPTDIDALVEQMFNQDRFALLLRPQIAGNLTEADFGRALRMLGENMALVPDGDVQLEEGDTPRAVSVQRFFLDRYPVTNQQYQEFVLSGGYEQASFWDPAILPGVLEFIDRTGQPGPKYWQDGYYPPGEEKHPVMGVNWYEASAFARWVGKRLPSDAEWIKAGAWPVRISSTTQVQRRYPWGDSMDRLRANLWGSGPGRTTPVDQYPGGISAGGIYQLIGNVWEWTVSNYMGASLPQESIPNTGLKPSTPLRSIRGGAFDTYFDNQASCQFQSGENPLNRRNNIGFRCAVGVCDLTLVRPVKEAATWQRLVSGSVAESSAISIEEVCE